MAKANDISSHRLSGLARHLVVFSYGLFAISAQTLLFREFLTTFEGNDISVGIFFACWFLWVGCGAIVAAKADRLADRLLPRIELLLLAYLPAFVLQWLLIVHFRRIAGVQSYTLLSVRHVLFWSALVNAPVSFVTGLFFPLACRWFRRKTAAAVSRVYLLEAAGSFVGGSGTTILLALKVNSADVFFLLIAVIALSAFFALLLGTAQRRKTYRLSAAALSLTIVVLALGSLLLRAQAPLMHYVRSVKWAKLLPPDAYRGSFQTSQAEYLYGSYNHQWLAVSQGSVVEALPDEEQAGRIAALVLSQKPDAQNVLVVGSGLALARQLLILPQIQHLTWTHCDSQYVRRVTDFVPDPLKITDPRFDAFAGDIRPLLDKPPVTFDAVIINLPDVTSSVLNRYYTVEFYQQLNLALAPDAVLAVRIPGGENIMGTELISIGASARATLHAVFANSVLVPGQDTWFLVSQADNLTGRPATLRDRFASIDRAAEVYPPQGLLSIYLPDRAEKALAAYATADLPDTLLVNRDARPLTHLYSLLLAAKQSQAPVAKLFKRLIIAGPLVFIIPILLFVFLRLTYILKTRPQKIPGGFDSTFLVFSTGAVGIGVAVTLMYLYQIRFGSLYLHIGVISSLYMAGLTAGAAVVSRLATKPPTRKSPLASQTPLLIVFALHTAVLLLIALAPAAIHSHAFFAAAFVLCGICGGCYFPLAARRLENIGLEPGPAAARLETADHLGAAAGGLLTALALVPVLGTRYALLVFILIIVSNVPAAVLSTFKQEKFSFADTTIFKIRRLGYVLFGIGASVILCSNLLTAAAVKLRPALDDYTAQALAGEMSIQKTRTSLPDTARPVTYYAVYDPNQQHAGYIISSADFAPDVRGFGGKINLALFLDPNGTLTNFHILHSNETPAYLDMLSDWYAALQERPLFKPAPFADIDAVTGATVSSQAVLAALEDSAHLFARDILGKTIGPAARRQPRHARYVPDAAALCLALGLLLTLLVIFRGGFRTRLVVLSFNLVAAGILLNAQYSTEQIATLLSFNTPAPTLSAAFLLVVAVPITVALFGNIYCGYLCPFGAAQELLGYLLPRRFKQPIPQNQMRIARFAKYIILLIVILVFFLSRNRTTLASDPLIRIFNLRSWTLSFDPVLALIVAVALLGSLLYSRFWCRYLCPVGAFLSLFNNLAILKHYMPPKRFARCEFGVTASDRTDCICCDKCRFEFAEPAEQIEPPPQPVPAAKRLSRRFILVVVIAALLVSAVSLSRFRHVVGLQITQPTLVSGAAGQPRDIDTQKIQTMIRENKLSDHEAEYYKKLER